MANKTLLIADLNPPYDEEFFYNFSLLNSDREKFITLDLGGKGYLRFLKNLFKKVRHIKDVKIVSKAYTRPSLVLIFFAVFVAKLFRKKSALILYPELFNFFGNFRSKLVGEIMLCSIFTLSSQIYYVNETTKEVILKYYNKPRKLSKIVMNIPNKSFVIKKDLKIILDKNKKLIIFNEPIGFLLEVCKEFIKKYKGEKDYRILILNKKKLNFKETKDVYLLEDYSVDDLIMLWSKARTIFSPLKCNNKIISPDSSMMVKTPIKEGGFTNFKSYVVLKKNNFSPQFLNI